MDYVATFSSAAAPEPQLIKRAADGCRPTVTRSLVARQQARGRKHHYTAPVFVILTWIWLIHLPATAVYAQDPALARPSDVERALDREPPTPRHHTSLLISGAATFVTSYLATAVMAAALGVVNAADCEAGNIVESCDDARLMLIPLVGPFLTEDDLGFQLAFAGPQILGALLAVAGALHYASGPVYPHERASLTVYPVPLPTGGALSATLTF